MAQTPGERLPILTIASVPLPVYQDKLASGIEQGPDAITPVRSLGLHESTNDANASVSQPPGQLGEPVPSPPVDPHEATAKATTAPHA